ncbi:MAG: inositol monophosphatase family protein, partial [Acidobacteriota bacterium]
MTGDLTPFESDLVASLGAETRDPAGSPDDARAWLALFASAACDVAGRLRAYRFMPLSGEVAFKEDHSPVTAVEREVEHQLRRRIHAFDRSASVVGEEHGGQLHSTGVSIAIDPVDGTWALLNRSASFAISIAALRDGEPWL